MKHHLFVLAFIGLGMLPVADVQAQYDTSDSIIIIEDPKTQWKFQPNKRY